MALASATEGQIEKQSFSRYALVTVQIDHAQALKLQAQYRWINHPDHPIWFPQMEGLILLPAVAMSQTHPEALNKGSWRF